MKNTFTKNQPSGRNKVFYGLLAGNTVVLALVGVLAVRPAFGQMQKHTTEITRTTAELNGTQEKTLKLRQLKEAYPQYAATYAPILQSIPRDKDVAGYQTELDALATLTSIQLRTVDTSDKAPAPGGAKVDAAAPPAAKPKVSAAGGFPSTTVRIEIAGSYASVLDFVRRVETMARITKVTSMDLQANATTGSVQGSLELQTLYIPGEKI